MVLRPSGKYECKLFQGLRQDGSERFQRSMPLFYTTKMSTTGDAFQIDGQSIAAARSHKFTHATQSSRSPVEWHAGIPGGLHKSRQISVWADQGLGDERKPHVSRTGKFPNHLSTAIRIQETLFYIQYGILIGSYVLEIKWKLTFRRGWREVS